MKKITVGLTLCLTVFSAGLVTQAAQKKISKTDYSLDRSDLDIPDFYFPDASEVISDEAFKEILEGEKTLALPDNEASILDIVTKWKDFFIYTDQGGLNPANPKCNLFLSPEGELGSYGRIIRDYIDDDIKKNSPSVFLSDSILGMASAPGICPNWSRLDQDARVKFWVWTFAAIASAESGCRWDVAEHWGVNDTCSGLLQLEKGYKLRSRRGSNCANVSPTDIRKPYGNLRCGLDIMKQQLVSPNLDGALEFDGRIYPGPGMMAQSYWQKLRKENGADIGRLMRAFKPCGAGA